MGCDKKNDWLVDSQCGDVVFFDNTYDRNKNHRLDDPLTHIAIVVAVDSDETVQMVHLGGSGITDLTMNVKHPTEHKSPEGKLWNSYLRVNRKGESSPRLTGQLFRSYARIYSILMHRRTVLDLAGVAFLSLARCEQIVRQKNHSLVPLCQ